jgi:N-formylglutamate amidohydrolase
MYYCNCKKELWVFYGLLLSCIFISCKPPQKAVPVRKKIDAFTEVQYGNMPLVISVPHGGTLGPDSIPDRTCPDAVTTTDLNTVELLFAIDSVFKKDFGIQPYFVVTHLKRIKLDQNRALSEASCNNNRVLGFWRGYHGSIDSFIKLIVTKYKQCLFIDLHGHGHEKQRLELGYLVNGTGLRNPSSIVPSATSVFHLLQQNNSITVQQLLTGPNAFGTLMAARGFPAVPSTQIPAPSAGDPYLDGGFNTEHFTGAVYPAVYGWQIEANNTGVRNNDNSRASFAKAFVQSIMQFYRANTSLKPSSFGK